MDAIKREEDFALLLELRKKTILETDNQLIHLLRLSTMLGCYTFLKNSAGTIVGYYAWADVIRETVSRLCRNGEFPFYPYEWSEGNIMLIIDACFLPEFSNEAKFIFRKTIKRKRAIAYRKSNKIKLWIKCFGRHSQRATTLN